MRKIIKFIFIAVLAAVCYTLPAQQGAATPLAIEGTVIDAITSETLPGVTITIKGRLAGTTSDMNGKFSIRAYMGEWLVFSFVGYETQEQLVSGSVSDMVVSLSESSQLMEEVVVTAVGAQRRISMLAAVTTVDAKELQTPAPSIANMLGGRVAGLITMQASGEPGKNLAEFWVRGISTFGAGSSALVLIDGLEGDLNSIDPADVESFSVLKDASATAVYGVRGANGVVLITTKRGESGKLTITGRANYTLSQIRKLPTYLRAYDYALLTNEAFGVRGELPRYTDIELQIIKNGLDNDFYPDVNWQEEIIRPISFKQTYYISGRGGSDAARYFVSLGGSSDQGAYKVEKGNYYTQNVGYNTYSFRLNLDLNLSKTTLLKFNSDAFMAINNRPGLPDTTDEIWNMQAQVTPLLFPIIYSNGQMPYGGVDVGSSPYMMLNHYGKSKLQDHNAKFSMALEQDLGFITEGLKFRVLGSYDRNGGYQEIRAQRPAMYMADRRNNRGELLTIQTYYPDDQEMYGLVRENTYRAFTLESAANYDRVFDEVHRVGGLLFFHLNDNMNTRQWDREEMGSLLMGYRMIPKRYVRLTGRLAYGYQDTYMVDFNFGVAGTENFMPGKQYGFFPAIALGWVPSNYDVVKEIAPWMELFKIRASYGMVGNDRIGGSRFPYLNSLLSGSSSLWQGQNYVDHIFIIRVGADNLEWEKAIKTNLGFDVRMLKDKLTFTVDFFQDRRDGIFQERTQIPSYVGLTNTSWGNVGGMLSWGTDGNASYTYEISRDMSATIRGNYTFAKNKITRYEKPYVLYPYQDDINQPNEVWRGLQCLGFFKNQQDVEASPTQAWGTVMPGDLKYKDVNGDGVIDDDDKVPISYKEMFPIFFYGFGGSFNYKPLSVGLLFRGTGKVDYYRNGTGYIPFNAQRSGNALKQHADPSTRWIPRWYCEANGIDVKYAENPNAELPLLRYGRSANNVQLSDFWRSNAQYLRLQEVTINYNLRNDFLKRMGIASLDLQLVANNLYVWDKVKIFDPEQAHKLGAVYPIPSTYSFQLFINL